MSKTRILLPLAALAGLAAALLRPTRFSNTQVHRINQG